MSWRTMDQSNNDMVDKFVRLGIIQSKSTVEKAFRCVSRAAFVPDDLLDEAFFDAPIRGEPNLHLSAPHMYASILEELELEPGMSFLNIGSGTGYFSSLVGSIIKTDGINHGIELHGDLVQYANDRVDDLLQYGPYDAKEICRPCFIVGNCLQLDTNQMKYDRLYCGAACPQSKVKFLMEFVKVGGLLIAPIGPRLVKIEKVSAKEGSQISLFDVCFASLVMRSAGDLFLPKLRFPEIQRKKSSKPSIYPAIDFPIGRNESQKTLSKLRALSCILDCFHYNSDLPAPLCYVPSMSQVNDLKTFLNDISFNGKYNHLLIELGTKHISRSTQQSDRCCVKSDDIWEHIATDKTWEIVLQHWFSLCSTDFKKQKQSLNLLLKLPKDCSRYYEGSDSLECLILCEEKLYEEDLKQACGFFNIDADTQLSAMINHPTSAPAHSLEASLNVDNNPDFCQGTSSSEASVSAATSSANLKQPKPKQNVIPLNFQPSLLNNMSQYPDHHQWTTQHDQQLIHLISKVKPTADGTKHSSNTILKPELLTSKLIRAYPLLENIPSTALCYRAAALIRIANLVDSLLVYIVGLQSPENHFKNPFEEKYPLPSFDDKSFESSGVGPYIAQLDNNSNRSCSSPQLEMEYGETSEAVYRVHNLICSELDKVKNRKNLVLKQIEVIDDIIEQYSDQLKLIQMQMDLISEQQQLLLNCGISTERLDASSRQLLYKTKALNVDGKQYLLQLLRKQHAILTKQTNEQSVKESLMNNLEQLISLENRLESKINVLASRKEHTNIDIDLIGLHNAVTESDKLLKQLHASHNRTRNTIVDDKNLNTDTGGSCQSLSNLLVVGAAISGTKPSSNRYHPQSILKQCQAFLPLSTRRWSIVKELLRSSEIAPPKYLPIISIDRQTPLTERHIHPSLHSVFMQTFIGLKGKDLHYRWNKKSYEQWWEVKFCGEGIIDQGGGFRDSLVEISEELCPSDGNTDSCLSLFIKTPNQRDKFGEYRSCYIPNPLCTQWKFYNWVGQLMGAAFRTDESLPISLAPYAWKMIVGEHVTWKDDYVTVDVAAVEMLDCLDSMQPETFDEVYGDSQYFVTALSGSTLKPLVSNGEMKIVTADNKKQFTDLARRSRMLENCKQIKAIRDGFLSTIPANIMSCLTWRDLEVCVCGEQEISVADLRDNCRFGSDLCITSDRVVHLWNALRDFSNEDRSRFLRFVTGRKRLPSPFIVSCSADNCDSLPTASTCASSLFLPEYSSEKIATEKLRYAINNCVAIDTDTSPWN